MKINFNLIVLGVLIITNTYSIYKIGNLNAEIQKRPEIMTIDVAHLLIQSTSIESTPEDIALTARKIEHASKMLANAGYLVIDTSAVLAAPFGISLTSTDIERIGMFAPPSDTEINPE